MWLNGMKRGFKRGSEEVPVDKGRNKKDREKGSFDRGEPYGTLRRSDADVAGKITLSAINGSRPTLLPRTQGIAIVRRRCNDSI